MSKDIKDIELPLIPQSGMSLNEAIDRLLGVVTHLDERFNNQRPTWDARDRTAVLHVLHALQAAKAADFRSDVKHFESIEKIAKKHLRLDTLETRGSDRLDFKDQAVWSIKAALEEAYEAGAMANNRTEVDAAELLFKMRRISNIKRDPDGELVFCFDNKPEEFVAQEFTCGSFTRELFDLIERHLKD